MSAADFQKKLDEAQNSRGYSDYAQSSGNFRGEIEKANICSQVVTIKEFKKEKRSN